MSDKIGDMVTQVHRLAAALSRIRTSPAKVEVIARPQTDRTLADRRRRLEDPKEIAALKRRLGLR